MGLEAHGLVKTFRNRRVVNDVNVSIDRGEVVGLLGPNGAGKTTTFYMVVGLLTPDRGRILLDGRDITDLPMYQPLPAGHRLPAAGVLGLPQADGRGEPPRDPRDDRPQPPRAAGAARTACSGSSA